MPTSPAVYTHTNPVRPYRGNGRPEAAYVIERLVDLAADELGIDPAELRRRNIIPPERDAVQDRAHVHLRLRRIRKDHGRWRCSSPTSRASTKRRAESHKRGKLRGLGISNTIERAGTPGFEGAEVRFDRSGAVTLFSGSVQPGPGPRDRVQADRLRPPRHSIPNDVHYVQGDTDKVFFGEGTGGSRSATLGGSAFHGAAEKIIAKAQDRSPRMCSRSTSTTSISTDGIFSSAEDQPDHDHEGSRARRRRPEEPAEGHGRRPDRDRGLSAPTWRTIPNGCHVCEVEIDRDTGAVEIVRYSVVDDVGTVINPMLLHGQINGGVAQGIGQILMEDIHFDAESGQLVTGSFMDYAMPRAGDFSAHRRQEQSGADQDQSARRQGLRRGRLRRRHAGGRQRARRRAVRLGVRHIEMPATPERVWRAIQEARAKTA